jgi:hypothetical protein
MISNEVSGNSQPAGWKASDGRLWFPALKGVVIVDPKELPENTNPPKIIIERAILNSTEINLPQKELYVPPGSGRAEFHFIALIFASQNKVQYRIKLEGFDKEWMSIGAKNEATYTNLPPGKYIFHVAACNNDNVWNESGVSLELEFGRLFYQTAWFYGILVLAVFTIAFGIYHWRVWQLLRREQELERRVEESLAEIKVLGGLIPICANCKKIRDDRGFWNQLESYIRDHSEASFTHGICPKCSKRFYGDIMKRDDQN